MESLAFTKLVMPSDLNPANRLFGGQMMKFIDEAAALYCFTKLKLMNVVTVSVSELTFLKPVFQGDVLEFYVQVYELGKTSITLEVNVKCTPTDAARHSMTEGTHSVTTCKIKFVCIDPRLGVSVQHGLNNDKLRELLTNE